jgi:GNAT superfamily N-acetyltransferase
MIELVPMRESEFPAYYQELLARYAAEGVQAGFWPESHSTQIARATVDRLLPHGVNTDGQHLWIAHDAESGAAVGHVWIGMSEQWGRRLASGYDFYVREEHRGRGCAHQLMEAVVKVARELGGESMVANLFGHNPTMRRVYERAGFAASSLAMFRSLTP